MKKKFLMIISIVLVVAAFVIVKFVRIPSVPAGQQNNWKTYQSEKLGAIFQYPIGYFIEEKQFDDHVLVMLTEDTQENKDVREGRAPGREGPTAITFAVYQNQLQLSAMDWAQQNQDSNFHLIIGQAKETTLAGKQGIAYISDGLYVADTIVVADANSVMIASATYMTPDDQIRKDFNNILQTISFIKK